MASAEKGPHRVTQTGALATKSSLFNSVRKRREYQTLKRWLTSAFNKARKWPRESISLEREPKFLFILTPPYSGSTALANLLNTAHGTMFLAKRGEGQWLVPGLCGTDRWDPQLAVDWESVKSVWLKKFQTINFHVANTSLIIEKSPCNLIRANQIREHFPGAAFVAFNRDPYANCASNFYRNQSPERRSACQRIAALQGLAERWMTRSRYIRAAITEMAIPHFTYEHFCEHSAECVAQLLPSCPEFATIDPTATVQVKDYARQGIVNQNPRQIRLLEDAEIAAMSAVLKQDESLLDFFGYQTRL